MYVPNAHSCMHAADISLVPKGHCLTVCINFHWIGRNIDIIGHPQEKGIDITVK